MKRFGTDPMRRGWRMAVGVVLVAMAFLVAPTPARAQSLAEVGGDIFDCGGRGEPACPAFSKFWENGNFGCDRGLKEENGRCVNDKRRQGVGRQFRESDPGRKLAMQRRLNWNRPIGLHSDISVHNAYENHADGYPGGSQRYSITEMLDAGFRQIELDVWTDSLGLGHPKLCHGACSGHDRFFSSALKELRDWLKEDGHENEIVIVLFDGYGFDANQVDLVDASIKAHLADDPAIGVYTGPSRWNAGGNPSQSATPWPSPSEMVRNGTRVLFLIQADSVGDYLKKERWGSFALSTGDNGGVKPTVVEGYPTCQLVITKNTGTIIDPVLSDSRVNIAPTGGDNSWMIKEVYPGAYLPTGEQLQSLASCGLDSIKMNYLLQTTEQDANSNGDPERLEMGVWSWAAGQPSLTTPGTAVQIHDNAVYAASMHAHHPDDVAPYLCNDPRAFPSLMLSVVGSGPWRGGFSACSAVGREFYAPRTGYEANMAIDAIPDNSQAWIALQTTGGIEGFDVREEGRSAIAVWDLASLGGTFEGVPAHLSLVSTQIITSVEWQFGDGTVLTREGDSTFPNLLEHTWASPGSYTIRAKLKLGDTVVEELSKTITVHQLSDLPFGPGIGLDERSASITEGERTFVRLSARWPIVGLQCGAAAALTAPLSTTVPASGGRYRAYFECELPGGASPEDRLIAHAAYPDPETGLPAIHPETGQLVTMSKYFVVPVADGKTPTVIAANASVPQDRVLNHTIAIDEVAGEPVTVKVKWPGLPDEVTYQTTAGQMLISWRARAAVGTHAVQVTVTDGETPLQTATFNVTVTAGQPPEIVGAEGPEFPAVGVPTSYYFSAKAPALGTLVPVSSSCGVGGTADGGVWFIKANDDGSKQFAVRCTFFQRGPSEVSVTFQSSSSALVTGRLDVTAYIKGVPDLIWMEAAANPIVGKKTTYYFGVRDRDGGDVAIVGASCGSQGAVTAGPTWTGTDPYGTESWGVQCLFGMPGESVIAMTFRGDSGAEATYTQVVSVGGIADQPPLVVSTDGPLTPEPRIDATYAFTVSDSSQVTASAPSCGTGQVQAGPTFVGFTPDSARIFSLVCSFPTTGGTTVSLTFSDADGGPTTVGAIAIQVTAILPTIAVADISVAAAGTMTPVSFSVTTGHATSVTCVPASGSSFPVGSTAVNCTALNAYGEASASFAVTVVDGVAPVITLDAPAVLEATGPSGAALVFSASALDNVDGPLVPACNVSPGTMVAVGASQTIDCMAVDASQNRSDASRTVSVRDSIAPTIAPAAAIVRPAADANGARVAYTAPSTEDIVDGAGIAICAPASGSLFPVGTTPVTCTAQDAAQNAATPVIFEVTVTPLVVAPPIINAPHQETAEATGPDGAVVRFQASARDTVDGRVPVTCSPASGSLFPLGSTLVTCTAQNSGGAVGRHELLVQVLDSRAPRLDIPEHLRVEAAGPEGAMVIFDASAHDAVDGAPTVACSPTSGSVFPLGRTTVSCSARDLSGNVRSGHFDVIVRDTIAPDIRSLTPSPSRLPASGERVPVTIDVEVFDAADAAPSCTIANVTSNVRDADRDGERDWMITGPLSLSLEAATRRHRDRSYRITVRCVDDSLNASREKTAVVISQMQ